MVRVGVSEDGNADGLTLILDRKQLIVFSLSETVYADD